MFVGIKNPMNCCCALKSQVEEAPYYFLHCPSKKGLRECTHSHQCENENLSRFTEVY